jgi:hypothetical protein
MVSKINLDEKFALFNEHWRPRVVADLNGQQVKIVKGSLGDASSFRPMAPAKLS